MKIFQFYKALDQCNERTISTLPTNESAPLWIIQTDYGYGPSQAAVRQIAVNSAAFNHHQN